MIGLIDGNVLNAMWCMTEMLTSEVCPKGAECDHSHCPPDRATVSFFLRIGTILEANQYSGRNFVFNVMKYYVLKYWSKNRTPILSPTPIGTPLQTMPPTQRYPLRFAFELPANFTHGVQAEEIFDEWERERASACHVSTGLHWFCCH